MDSGIITLISVAVNALAGVLGSFFARKIASQRTRLQHTEATMETLSDGLTVIERAVEENKDALSRTGAGDRIAKTIRTYGPAARQLVDAARSATRELADASASTREGAAR